MKLVYAEENSGHVLRKMFQTDMFLYEDYAFFAIFSFLLNLAEKIQDMNKNFLKEECFSCVHGIVTLTHNKIQYDIYFYTLLLKCQGSYIDI